MQANAWVINDKYEDTVCLNNIFCSYRICFCGTDWSRTTAPTRHPQENKRMVRATQSKQELYQGKSSDRNLTPQNTRTSET